jgi:hypothetical protein
VLNIRGDVKSILLKISVKEIFLLNIALEMLWEIIF